MLAGFLEGDRAFAKARKEGLPADGVPTACSPSTAVVQHAPARPTPSVVSHQGV
jgi:hypothetical protein